MSTNPLSLALPTAAGGALPQRVEEDLLAAPTTSASAQGLPFWGDNPDAWDTALIAGRTIPGRVAVTAKVKNRVDRKSVPGSHGAKYTHIGYAPAEVTLDIEVWTPEHLSRLNDLVRLIRPRKGTPEPVVINHPSLSMLDVSAVLVIEVGNLQRKGDSGVMHMTITAMEYVPAGNDKAKVGTAKSTKDAANFDNALTTEADKRVKELKRPSKQNAQP